jgi:hypothetical protein
MTEKRKSHRVKLSTRIIFSQEDAIQHGQLENISMSGALISLEKDTYLPQGSGHDLTLYIEGEEFPLQFGIEVVCHSFGVVGIRFLSYEDDTETRLAKLMEKLSAESSMESSEQEKSKRRLTEIYSEG